MKWLEFGRQKVGKSVFKTSAKSRKKKRRCRVMKNEQPWLHPQEQEYRRYTLWLIYACIIYSLIGFSLGALIGCIAEFSYFVDHRIHGQLFVRAHTHINLLGCFEMAIFAAV